MAKVSNAQLQSQLEALSTRLEETFKLLTSSTEVVKTEIAQKIDGINTRLDGYDKKFEKLQRDVQHTDNRVGEIAAQVENGDQINTQKFINLTARVNQLEEKLAKLEGLPARVEPLEEMPGKVSQLTELVEERTNRQLRDAGLQERTGRRRRTILSSHQGVT